MRSILPILLFLLAPTATAQFTFAGTVEKVAKAPSCSPKATHRIRCTEIHLLADTGVDLTKWEGKTAEMTGSLELTSCPTFKVKSAAGARYTFRVAPFLFGKFRIGERFTWRTSAPLLAIVPFLMAAKPGFVPLGQYGTYQLDPLGTLWLQNDIALLGFVLHIMQIPNDKNLVGLTVHGQGVYLALVNSQLTIKVLNADCFTVQPR